MKTLLQQAPRFVLLAACAGLGFIRPAQAAQPESGQPVNVDKVAGCTYLVRVSNPAQRWAKLELVRLSDGAVLHQDGSKRPDFGQKLNLSQLPDGQYAFVVTLNNNTHRYTIDLKASTQRSAVLSMAGPATR